MKVVIDTREKQKVYYKGFLEERFPKHEFILQKLDEGDFASENVLVERKEIADFFQSTYSHRLKDQVSRISSHEDKFTFILIHGNMERFLRDIDEVEVGLAREKISSIMYGSLASVTCRERIHIVWCEDVCDGLISMVKFMECAASGDYMIPLKREPERLFARFLGITPAQADQIKLRWSSIADFADACVNDPNITNQLCTIRGIGTVKSNLIVDLMLGSWHSWK